MRYTEDAFTLCPFYVRDSSRVLICEGIAEGCSNTTTFRSPVSKARYQERFCRNNYGSCELCKALMNKYN